MIINFLIIIQGEMIKEEYKRLHFSYKTLILIIVAVILTVINCYYTNQEYLELKAQLAGGTEDIAVENVFDLLKEYSAFYFLFQFYNNSDELIILIIALFAWIGIFVAVELYSKKESGYGNFLIIRSCFL